MTTIGFAIAFFISMLSFEHFSEIADFVISEDSDLTLFGCEKIVFKLDSSGNGVLYEKSKLPSCLGQRAENFTFEKFRYMGIMAG